MDLEEKILMQQRFYEINEWWKKTDKIYEFHDENTNIKIDILIKLYIRIRVTFEKCLMICNITSMQKMKLED